MRLARGSALAVAVMVSLFAAVPAFAQHDCRVRSALGIAIGNLPDGSVRLTAVYRAKATGAALSNRTCPDQRPPTWGSWMPIEFEDALGYRVRVPAGTPDGTYEFNVATTQGFDENEVLLFGSACLEFRGGRARAMQCSQATYARTRPRVYSRAVK